VAAGGLILGLCGGCVTARPRVEAALQATAAPTAWAASPARAYTLACPDRVDLSVAGWPEPTLTAAVKPDGTITLPGLGRVRLEGMTTDEAAEAVAEAAGVPGPGVRVRVAAYNSRKVFVCGPGAGVERAVPYQGPDTVVELLRRAGGLTPAAALNEIHVVRANVAAGRRPEVFPVDLEAILVRGDGRTNVRVQPYDQIYIGATRRADYARSLPAWMRLRGE
jgi:polysaccharide export outer membrane protein